MEDQWYFARNQKKFGPVSTSQLRKMAKAGQLGPDEMVLRVGDQKWSPAGTVDSLFPADSAAQVDWSVKWSRTLATLLANRNIVIGGGIIALVLFIAVGLMLFSGFGTKKTSTQVADTGTKSDKLLERDEQPPPSQIRPITPTKAQEKRSPTSSGTVKEQPATPPKKVPSTTPPKKGPPATSPKKKNPPPSFPAKHPLSAANRIIRRLYSVDSTKYTDRGYAGFTFGDSYNSIKRKLKKPTGKNSEQSWVLTKDGANLLFRKSKLVGVMKFYRSSMGDSVRALVKRFGKAQPDRITKFGSVRLPSGFSSQPRYSGEQLLIRYCFPNVIVYGYISSGDRSNLVGPYLWVSVFQRDYLEGVLRNDIQQKEKLLWAARPVIDYAFSPRMKWDKIPFPKVNGTHSGHGVNFFKEKVATLEGRSVPQGTQQIPGTPAIFVREQTTSGRKTMSVTIYFNSFPTYAMHPLTAPQPHKGGLWLRSEGIWHVEQDAQLSNAYLVGAMFPSANAKMKVSTVANPFVRGMDALAHKSFKMYTWETKDHWVQSLSCAKLPGVLSQVAEMGS